MEWFQSPMLLVLKLTVPVVDDEDVEMKGWNRHLNSLQCFTGPTFFIFATDREPGFCLSCGVFCIPFIMRIRGGSLEGGIQRIGRGGRRSEVMEQELGFLQCSAGPTFFILCNVL